MRRSLVPVCLVLLLLAGCQGKKPGSLRIDPSLAALAPPDTVFAAGANITAIRDTPVYRKLLTRIPLPQLDEFTKRTGLDPRKDLSEVLSCSNGKTGVLLARGNFHPADLEARLAGQGAVRADYKKFRLFGTGQTAIFFQNDSTAVAGPTVELRAMIDRNGTGGGLPVALDALLRTIPAGDQIWAALSGGLDNLNIGIPRNSNLSDIMQSLKSVQSATLGMDLSHGFNLVANVTCKTDRDAKFVHDMVRAMVGLGRLNTKDNQQELLKLYDAIQVTQQANQTHLSADIPADSADHFLDLWLKR